jgi:hypothetical protein
MPDEATDGLVLDSVTDGVSDGVSDGAHPSPMVIEVRELRRTLLHGLRMLVEIALVPTLLLFAFVHTVGGTWGLVAVIVWCAVTLAVRWTTARHLPGTLLLAMGMVVGRTLVALALSSVYVYLLQPVAGSLFMAVLFLGSAAIGRPVTVRLAQDFVSLPVRLMEHRRARRLFTEVCVVWGASRLVDAGMSLGFLRSGLDAGLFSRGMFSGTLTAVTIAVCAYWGWTRLNRIPGVVVRLG